MAKISGYGPLTTVKSDDELVVVARGIAEDALQPYIREMN